MGSVARNTVVVEGLEAAEVVVGASIEEAAGLLDVDHVRDRQEVATGIAEELAAAVALDVPGEAETRRDHVVDLDVGVAIGILVVEGFDANAGIQQQARCDRPVVFEVVGRIDRFELAIHFVLAGAHVVGADTGGNAVHDWRCAAR